MPPDEPLFLWSGEPLCHITPLAAPRPLGQPARGAPAFVTAPGRPLAGHPLRAFGRHRDVGGEHPLPAATPGAGSYMPAPMPAPLPCIGGVPMPPETGDVP